MEYFQKMNGYEKVPSPSATSQLDNPLYGSRLVAKGHHNSKKPDLYAATPLLVFFALHCQYWSKFPG